SAAKKCRAPTPSTSRTLRSRVATGSWPKHGACWASRPMGTFNMPSLGADMEAGTLVEWLKHPGDTVQRGDIVAVVETEKGAIEVEIFEDGSIEELLVG